MDTVELGEGELIRIRITRTKKQKHMRFILDI
jgi:hypothetical protein